MAITAGVVVAGVAGWLLLSSGGTATPSEALGAPRFIEETASGIEHVYDGEFTFFVGGGIAALDCDDDNLLDLMVAGGANQASLHRNVSNPGGSLRFERVLSPVTDLDSVTGAFPLDIDSDGVSDIVVARLGENVVLRGLGDCRFERANERWSIDGGDAWTVGFGAIWEEGETLPTLAFGNYIRLDENGQQFGGCEDNTLLRPDGETYGDATALSPGWCTLSVAFSDWDRTGRTDLRISNDRHYYRDGEEQLWQIEAGQQPRLYTRDDGWQKMQIWGMGIASHDVTGDGKAEVFLTSQADNKLQTLVDDATGPSYTDIAIRRGVTAHRPFTGDEILPSTAWHPEFQDVNNDGFVDLFVTKGNVEATPGYAVEDPNNLLLGQPDGTFVEGAVDAGIVDFLPSRGATVADFNLDGLLDIVYVNRREPVRVWRNVETDVGNWISIDFHQQGVNPDAIGAWIEVQVGDITISHEIVLGGGHGGDQLGPIHFGLGPADTGRVRVQWPDGEVGPWLNVAANQFVTIERGA
ncbi:MAG: CRTAC1 family protein, partial [Acidimicrobiia bacterium]|nr:CRTAC1 family protein [Acidimicrobiia bacterium]